MGGALRRHGPIFGPMAPAFAATALAHLAG